MYWHDMRRNCIFFDVHLQTSSHFTTPNHPMYSMIHMTTHHEFILLMEEILHQFRLIVYPIIYIQGFYIHPNGGKLSPDFSHDFLPSPQDLYLLSPGAPVISRDPDDLTPYDSSVSLTRLMSRFFTCAGRRLNLSPPQMGVPWSWASKVAFNLHGR